MTVLTKSAPIESLGLGPGVHLLKVVVAGDTVAFEVAASADRVTPVPRQGTGFVKTWSGSARRMDAPGDDWLAHINAKHLRLSHEVTRNVDDFVGSPIPALTPEAFLVAYP